MAINREYLIGGLSNLALTIILFSWVSGRFGNVPYIVAVGWLALPIALPFIFLALKRPRVGLGALVVGTVSFIATFFIR